MAPANQFMNFSQGHSEQKFNVNRAGFPKKKHQNSQKWAKFMNFSFWPFLWFGLPGRLLRECPDKRDGNPLFLGTLRSNSEANPQSRCLRMLQMEWLEVASAGLKCLKVAYSGLKWCSLSAVGALDCDPSKAQLKSRHSCMSNS